ncbi:MAG: hypothetical protein P9M14_00755 [Candidatus Alcyoniella australis]|nr:hypothetical protein [Candidatus Alcyoniella australis]
MASNRKVTSFVRKRKKTKMGKARKRVMRVQSTPAFPIHPDGKPAETKP